MAKKNFRKTITVRSENEPFNGQALRRNKNTVCVSVDNRELFPIAIEINTDIGGYDSAIIDMKPVMARRVIDLLEAALDHYARSKK